MSFLSFLQIPYRTSREGYWGEQTSTLNWCEEDYNITPYSAEVVNSLTNLTFLWLGVLGVRDCIRYDHPRIFSIAFVGYMIVGMGSIAFHSSLKYSMQLADELPMIYATCIVGYDTFSYAKSKIYTIAVGTGLISLATFITVFYWVTKNPVFHQVSYAALTAGIVFRAMYVMEYELRPAMQVRSPEKVDDVMRNMWWLSFGGVAMFLIGFGLWNIDNLFCVYLRSWRDIVLLPWAIVFEFHGWWHLFTGLAYYFIIWRLWLHRCLDGGEAEYFLQWPSAYTSIPRVVPLAQENGKGKRL